MQQFEFGESSKSTKEGSLRLEDLLQRNFILEAELERLLRELYDLKNRSITDEQLILLMQEQLESLRNAEFGASSENYKRPVKDPNAPKEPTKPRVKKPSERYPNIPVREEIITQNPIPSCPCCSKVMSDSGMTEDSEQLTVIPKKYEIIRQKRVKYRCSCQSAIVTAPSPERIIPGSTYSDEMILDVALSKYCDLIPVERYVAMADRGGVEDLPANSLIETTHALADFVSPAYTQVKDETLESRVLHADETPHRMLEGSEKKNWQLWGFSANKSCFFECRDTRSGDVASGVLLKSHCEFLVSDVFSGYPKAVNIANLVRQSQKLPLIKNAFCNAHSRRYFHQAWKLGYKEAAFYLDQFHEIYDLNSAAKAQLPSRVLDLRAQMRPYFEMMKNKAIEELARYSEKGKYAKALKYFLKNYVGLTLFLDEWDVPIDNNLQERLFRSPVVGRKTWYGTHSMRGALTAAILFTLVETCKLNGVNPREYFKCLVARLHAKQGSLTPYQFKLAQAQPVVAVAA